MKTFKCFILIIFVAGLFSCSTNYTPNLDDDPTFDVDTRSDTTQTDTIKTDGLGGTITDWGDGGADDIVGNEIPS